MKAIITGGNKGFGLAFANELSNRKFSLFSISRSSNHLQANFANTEDVMKAIDFIQQQKPGVLILNAGFGMTKKFEDYKYEELINLLNVNATANALILKACFPQIISGTMKVGVTTSIAGLLPSPLMAPYAAAKAYVVALIDSLNGEILARRGKNFILNIAPGNMNTKKQTESVKNFAKKTIDVLLKTNDKLLLSDPIYENVLKKANDNWDDFVINSYWRKIARINAKKNYHVFDFDGTIATHAKVSSANLAALKKIEFKVLNTSRAFSHIPQVVRETFDDIFTLNGSKYYQKQNLTKVFASIDKDDQKKIIDWAIKNNYNIAFNGEFFQNVKEKISQEFFANKNLKYSKDLIVPEVIYMITISHYQKVTKPALKIKAHVFAQSEKVLEFCANTKGNVKNIFPHYTAYGDNANDQPMFDDSDQFFVIGKDIKYTENWIGELND